MKRKGLIIGIIAAVVVLIGAGALYVFAGDYIENQVALLTKSDTEYYEWLANRQIKSTRAKIKLAEKVSGLTEGSTEQETVTPNTEGVLSLHVTDTFCDMFDLVSFKDEQLKVRTAGDGSVFGVELIPVYGGNELVTLRTLIDIDKKGIYVQMPTYRDEVIDLSPLLDKEIAGGKSARDIFAESFKAAGGMALQTKTDKRMSADDTAECFKYMADSYTEATLEKKQAIDIAGESVKVTKVTVAKTFSELTAQLQGLLAMLKTKGYLTDITELYRMLAEIQSGKYASAKTSLTLFVDMRGNIRGCDIECDVNATKVGLTVTQTDNDGATASDILVCVNSLKAANIAAVTSRKGRDVSCELTVTPEAFVQTLLPDYRDLAVKLELTGEAKKSEVKATLLKSGTLIANATVSTTFCEDAVPVINLAASKVIPADTILESEYINVNDIIGMLLGIIDRIDEPFVEDYINSLLAGALGESMDLDIDSVREMYDMGVFKLLGGLGDLIGMKEEPAIPGVVSVEPEEYVRPPYSIPKDKDVITYSHLDLAGTSNVGKYKGIAYAVPVSKDITQEQLQNKRDKLLKSMENRYLIDQRTISVEMGDEIYMDIVPLIGGRPFNAYSFEDCYERMGDDAYGDGLDSMLLGMKVGDVRDVNVTLGSQFGDFAGYSGTFRVTLNAIERYAVPVWNEEFVCGYAGYSSLEDCDKKLMAELIAEADVSEEAVKEVLLNMVWEENDFLGISEEAMNALRQEMYERLYDESVEYGMKPEEYYINDGGTLEDFLELFDLSVNENLEAYSIYATIAAAENITVTGKEVNEMLEYYEEVYECTLEELMDAIRIYDISDMLIEEKISQFIYDTAIITYE